MATLKQCSKQPENPALAMLEPKTGSSKPAIPLGVDSFSILFNHPSVRKPDPFPDRVREVF